MSCKVHSLLQKEKDFLRLEEGREKGERIEEIVIKRGKKRATEGLEDGKGRKGQLNGT